ncbi:MAG: hypothetical protein FWF15_05440 [Oscillospiraceae bacterium]|nr:hypothetical protein [Oscillospiraceae bacterium]
MFETYDLCFYDWLVLLRDAMIYKASQTESGRKYLEKCRRLEQTEPDRQKLRERYKAGGD